MQRHSQAVANIAARVKEFHKIQKPFRIYHGSTNSTRPSKYRQDNIIDTSGLTNVLKIDHQAKTALVEPNVPMDQLVQATLTHNLLPHVVMEFPGITCGGAFAGTGGESSSFRRSWFDQNIKSLEMVLPDGEIANASESTLPDLFHGAASTCGTLGVTTLLEVELRDACPYVELNYHPITSMSEALAKFKEAASDKSVDFIDGILFAKNKGVICIGRLTDQVKPGLNVQTFSKSTDPWFYLHVKSLLQKQKGNVSEAIPVEDYLFRYDRGAFWMGSYAFKYFKFPFNRATRWMLDRVMHTRVMFHALHKSGLDKIHIIQDLSVPFDAANDFLEYLDQDFKQYPLWLCPILQSEKSAMSPHSLHPQSGGDSHMILNFGVWGLGPSESKAFIEANRRLEQKTHDFGGSKWLYAHSYYTEEEFWAHYDRAKYDSLRAKYHATYLPSVYEKVKVDLDAPQDTGPESTIGKLNSKFWSIWPMSGLYAVAHSALRSDYLMQKPSHQQQAPLKEE